MGCELKRETYRRCPKCEHVSTDPVEEGRDFYFRCRNQTCKVGRIYGDNAVMLIIHEEVAPSERNEEESQG